MRLSPPGGGAALALLAGAVLGGAALAVTLGPTEAQRQQATERGRALADRRQGYPVQDYLLYSVPDALTLLRGEGSVEAVQLATPLERTRWAGYFLAVQGKAVTPQGVRDTAGLGPGQIGVIVYAHSPGGNETDQDFLGSFGPARLTLNGRTLTPARIEHSGVSRDHYRGEDGQVVFRWTGTLTYRFDLSELGVRAGAAQGRVQFTDATGRRYDLPLDLARYR